MVAGCVVLAKWKSTKYPAIVKGIMPTKMVSIEFFDGVAFETELSAVQTMSAELQKEVGGYKQEINN